MFDESIIVQSAISAFNNAALAAPAFLWWAVLAIPLFVFVYFCGNDFLEKIGWNRKSLTNRFSLITVMFSLAWIILFGGNYDVLRDNATVLPFMVAAISFVASLFIGSHTKNIKLSKWHEISKARKIQVFSLFILILLFIGLSDLHAWWGPILQIGAVVGGMILGRVAKYEMRPIPGTLLVILAIITAILMQPEFFRFGQLGSLTAFHLLFLLLAGCAVMITVALRNVNARSKIRRSAYIKIKWLVRFISLLCIALFVLTESVPVFLGTLFVVFCLCALSIWHSEKVSEVFSARMFALSLGLFGILTVMPVITALGILYWMNLPQENFLRQLKALL